MITATLNEGEQAGIRGQGEMLLPEETPFSEGTLPQAASPLPHPLSSCPHARLRGTTTPIRVLSLLIRPARMSVTNPSSRQCSGSGSKVGEMGRPLSLAQVMVL